MGDAHPNLDELVATMRAKVEWAIEKGKGSRYGLLLAPFVRGLDARDVLAILDALAATQARAETAEKERDDQCRWVDYWKASTYENDALATEERLRADVAEAVVATLKEERDAERAKVAKLVEALEPFVELAVFLGADDSVTRTAARVLAEVK